MALQKVGAGIFTMNGHIIPDTNAAYDFGSAEFKIRHLFLSDNSLWVGDNHKVDTEEGTYKIRKRKKGKVPQGVINTLIPSTFANEADLLVDFKLRIHDPAPATILDPGHADFNPPINKWQEYMGLHGHPDKSADELYDNAEDFDQESSGIPSGCIVMWSGAIANIPDGYVLCDGSNSTPDLRDRFVIGAGNSHAVDATGGSTSVGAHTLTIAEMPSHTHSAAATSGASDGDNQKPAATMTTTGATGGGGSHTHTGTLPPYYALAYIMKT